MPPLTLNVGESTAAPQVHREIYAYAANPIFGQCNSFIIEGNPYCRPIRPQDLADQDFDDRMVAVPVRIPLPDPVDPDSIYTAQNNVEHRYFGVYEEEEMAP
jgi:hypothetical protein